MKKWILLLISIIIAGTISSAAIAGRVYYSDTKKYEDSKRVDLIQTALENIYISSAIPVEVKPTDGEAYVEFNQRFVSVIGDAPTYTLDVQTKGDASYITLSQEKFMDIGFMVKENKALCTLYLPQDTINKLEINSEYGHYSINNGQNTNINLSTINVKNLQINTYGTNILLEGAYENVKVEGNAKLIMRSKAPAKVQLNGDIKSNLTGQYEKVEISDSNQSVWIDSQTPAEVWTQSNNGEIRLRGSYTRVDIQGTEHGTIDVKSDTLCKIAINNYYGDTQIEGAFEDILVNTEQGSVTVNSTVIPKKISLLGQLDKITLMLPSNLPGMDLTYSGEYFNPNQEPFSDFALQKEYTSEQVRKYTFGDQSTKILVQAREGNALYVLDNGYISGQNISEEASENTKASPSE
ncbi:hypothetical protein CS063_16075 [Sporanaerobium hydrogeniformans]|uniref:Uncharacterized protein n=1 Tax=Sporanaerobium hydrogeniformans TaxID=3072179 RepID=A0AC61D9I3_9FIRM|nr:DUF4097 family beta strand repeat-containing protein [Sporanaerobium hydrogeniformans]PHV69398.1 hypothetical protein CS063_16075 [Sporanaerobium hydrogeniformans]